MFMEKSIERELKTPSKLQVEDDAFLYIAFNDDVNLRIMPLSVNWLFVPCKITAVKFTPSKVYYDVTILLKLPVENEESRNIRLHQVDSALLLTIEEYCARAKNNFVNDEAVPDGMMPESSGKSKQKDYSLRNSDAQNGSLEYN